MTQDSSETLNHKRTTNKLMDILQENTRPTQDRSFDSRLIKPKSFDTRLIKPREFGGRLIKPRSLIAG